MKKPCVYILLIVFSINIFSAGTSEFIHQISHLLQPNKHNFHVHHQHHVKFINEIQNHHHNHGKVLDWMMKAFDNVDKNYPFLGTINLLMISLNGIIVNSLISYKSLIFQRQKITLEPTFYLSNVIDILTPPPRFIA